METPKHRSISALLEQLQPLHDFVLVKRTPDNLRYGRIYLPDGTQNPMKPGLKRGTAIACGRGDKLSPTHRGPMGVKPGDEVIWTRTPANNVVINNEEYVFIHEECIYGIVEHEEAA